MSEWLPQFLSQLELSEEHEEYLYTRGIKEETLSHLQPKTWIGKAPSIMGYHGGGFLQGRLVLPLYSICGEIIGFEARDITKKKVPFRYLLKSKAHVAPMANVNVAFPKLWDGGNLWIVEGFFDVFALEWGVDPKDAVIGTLTASFSRGHQAFAKRFCRGRVFVAYDNDTAGREATYGTEKRRGALKMLSQVGKLSFPVAYKHKDPGEVWRKGGERLIKEMFSRVI